MDDVAKQIVANALPTAAGILGYFRPLEAARLIGVVLTIGGAAGWVYPVTLAKTFGIPYADINNSIFFPGIGGRNAAAGLTSLMLSFKGGYGSGQAEGYRKALGVLLAFWTLAGFSDTWILMTTPGSENVFVHLRNIAVLGIVSSRLLTLRAS